MEDDENSQLLDYNQSLVSAYYRRSFCVRLLVECPKGVLFSYDQPVVTDEPRFSSVHTQGTRHWVKIIVPREFPGSTRDFLRHYGLLLPPGPYGENTNWYILTKNRCQRNSSQQIEDNRPHKGEEFWFASGYPPPDRHQKPILPPGCDSAR